MADPRDIVERFVGAFYGGDAPTARRYLADDLSFVGPGATFSAADDFLRASAHVAPGVRAVERRKVFVDGQDVCVVHDLVLNHRAGTLPVAGWYHLDGDRIASIRMFFDTGPFSAGRREQPDDTAVDPVCGMTVRKAAAAATRSHEGATYYFCATGCAVAFERDPASYLASSR